MNALPRLTAWLAITASVVLAGCSTMRLVDSEVRSFAGSTDIVPNASYRFDHLPSQRAAPQQQATLERLASEALAAKGLVHNDATARYGVLVQVRAEQYQPVVWEPTLSGRLTLGPFGRRWRNLALLELETTQYRHAVELLIRDLTSGHIVFESHAVHDSRWADTLVLLPAILQAALHSYPQASPTPHTVVVELPPTAHKAPK